MEKEDGEKETARGITVFKGLGKGYGYAAGAKGGGKGFGYQGT